MDHRGLSGSEIFGLQSELVREFQNSILGGLGWSGPKFLDFFGPGSSRESLIGINEMFKMFLIYSKVI